MSSFFYMVKESREGIFYEHKQTFILMYMY